MSQKSSPNTLWLLFLGALLAFGLLPNFVTNFIDLLDGKESLPALLLVTLISVFVIVFMRQCFKERRTFFTEKSKHKETNDHKAKVAKKVREEVGEKSIRCSYIGGSGYGLNQPTEVYISIFPTLIKITSALDGSSQIIAISEIKEIEIGGPGKVVSNAGVSGGGFGLEGFLQGAIAATLINAATTKSTTNTFLRILTKTGELYIHTSEIEPINLKMELSPAFVYLANKPQELSGGASSLIAEEIAKLHQLKLDGLLDDDEFKIAKNKILNKST
jgi:hypothetical protein